MSKFGEVLLFLVGDVLRLLTAERVFAFDFKLGLDGTFFTDPIALIPDRLISLLVGSDMALRHTRERRLFLHMNTITTATSSPSTMTRTIPPTTSIFPDPVVPFGAAVVSVMGSGIDDVGVGVDDSGAGVGDVTAGVVVLVVD